MSPPVGDYPVSRLVPLAFLAAAVAQAAPAPKTKDSVYFPTKEGDTRVYEIRVGEKVEGGYTDVVTKVEKKDDAVHVTITRERAGTTPFVTTISVTNEGLFRVAIDGEKLEKPIPLLKMPAKVGTKWELDGGTKYAVTKEEEVEVPAGKFQAIRVESGAGTSKTTLWFAPGVGLIKMASEGSDRVQVLKEFKAAK
jgi:hypothetical protein